MYKTRQNFQTPWRFFGTSCDFKNRWFFQKITRCGFYKKSWIFRQKKIGRLKNSVIFPRNRRFFGNVFHYEQHHYIFAHFNPHPNLLIFVIPLLVFAWESPIWHLFGSIIIVWLWTILNSMILFSIYLQHLNIILYTLMFSYLMASIPHVVYLRSKDILLVAVATWSC